MKNCLRLFLIFGILGGSSIAVAGAKDDMQKMKKIVLCRVGGPSSVVGTGFENGTDLHSFYNDVYDDLVKRFSAINVQVVDQNTVYAAVPGSTKGAKVKAAEPSSRKSKGTSESDQAAGAQKQAAANAKMEAALANMPPDQAAMIRKQMASRNGGSQSGPDMAALQEKKAAGMKMAEESKTEEAGDADTSNTDDTYGWAQQSSKIAGFCDGIVAKRANKPRNDVFAAKAKAEDKQRLKDVIAKVAADGYAVVHLEPSATADNVSKGEGKVRLAVAFYDKDGKEQWRKDKLASNFTLELANGKVDDKALLKAVMDAYKEDADNLFK